MSRIYTYAVIDSNKEIDFSLAGLEGNFVFNIPYYDIGIVVSDLNGEMRSISKRCVWGHEEVIDRLMESFTVLPMRFLTVFNKKEDVFSVMRERYRDFKDNLDKFQNKSEFGIKVIWPGQMIREQIKKENESINLPGNRSPAKNFMQEKFQEYRIDRLFKEEADKYIVIVDKFFSGFAVEKRYVKLKTENLLLNASYLVEKEREDDFKDAFKQLRSVTSDLRYLFSGPWPPYNFVSLNKKSIGTSLETSDMFESLLRR